MRTVIHAVSNGAAAALVEIRKLGPSLVKRTADILAFVDWPGTSNGPTMAINGRLEQLRGLIIGSPNLKDYIAQCLLET